MEQDEKLCPFCAEPIKVQAIRCKHCQADLSQKILLPVNERLPSDKKSSVGKILLWIALVPVVAIGGLMFIGAVSRSSVTEVDSRPPGPGADQQVWLDESAYGCLSTVDLDNAMDHYARAEYSAWADITSGPLCFYQHNLPPDLAWTVLQVRDDRMQIGIKRAVEYSKAPQVGRLNYWTLTKWALLSAPPSVPANPPKPSAVKVGSISKPANFSAPIRASADPSAPILRGVKIGSTVQVYQLQAGMARISKNGKAPEWVVPETLDW